MILCYIHMCMYVCMYVCTYVCMYACTYTCTYVCTYARMYVCKYIRTCICTYLWMYICTYCTYVSMYVCMHVCNTCTPQIKVSFCGLHVMYHNHSSPGLLQLSWGATTSQWNVVKLPIGMHIIILQHQLVCML